VSQLCFEVGGILYQLPAQLGDTVVPFDFTTFYAGLGATVLGDPSLLSFNSAGILSAPSVTASILAALRAETRKAALDKAVNARQNAYFAKYGNVAGIVSTVNTFYGAGSGAKPALLQNLTTLAATQASLLEAAYTTDGRTGVVRTTNSTLSSLTVTNDTSSSSGSSTSTTTPDLTTTTTPDLTTTSTGQTNQVEIGAPNFTGVSFDPGAFPGPPVPGGGQEGAHVTGGNQDLGILQEGASGGTSTETGISTAVETGTSIDTATSGQTATGKAYAVQSESIVNTDYGYRVPFIECQAQNERAQISLIDQQFAQFMANQNLPNLAAVFQNELSSIDLSVYQLQVGFLNTILLSPIAGTVTGVYKNPGDPVRPGEPVVRVEDNSTLFLLTCLIFRGPIRIGSIVTVTTALFDASGPLTTLPGSVVAVRGRSDDDEWDLVVQCANPLDGSGNPIFPIGYNFDYDNTTVSIT
jgi:biotin carboxyl carrier protein